MTRLLLDMCVDRRVAAALAGRGHDAAHVAEIGMATARDSEILGLAPEQGRAVVTHDHDFAQLLAHSAARGPSVIHVRMPIAAPEEPARAIHGAVLTLAEDLARGCVASLSLRGVRVRGLPVGKGSAEPDGEE